MKLTPELIAKSDSALNALQDRQLDLRGHKIPAVENLGVTRDQCETIDLTDNDIRALAGFPTLVRLRTLVVANNLVARIDRRLAHALPRLQSLVLTNNALQELGAIDPLARFPLLEFLCLMGNPLARKPHYREYVVWRCKHVRVLDFQRVKQAERQKAQALMESADGRPSALAVSLMAKHTLASETTRPAGADHEMADGQPAQTFEVGSVKGEQSASRQRMSADERKALEDAIENSTSLEEIKRLEDRLRLGYAIAS